jgi:hypothetical protein
MQAAGERRACECREYADGGVPPKRLSSRAGLSLAVSITAVLPLVPR